MRTRAPRADRRDPARGHRRQLLRSFWGDARWWAILSTFLVAGVLGFIGFQEYQRATGGPEGTSDVLYLVLQLYVLDSGALEQAWAIPVSLQVARFLAPVATIVLAQQALAPLVRDQLQLLRLQRSRDHVVVCGLGERGLSLARSIRTAGQRVVAVERDGDAPQVQACRDAGVPVLVGDATDPAVLHKAGTARATRLVAACGDDGVNANIAASAESVTAGRSHPLDCVVHIFEPQLCSLLRSREDEHDDRRRIRLGFFNTFESGAQALLLRHRPFPDRGAAEPHLLVVGLGWFGASLVVQAARNWHATRPDVRRGLHITVVDRDAAALVDSLLLRHPPLDDVADIVAVDLDVGSPGFSRGGFLERPGAPPVSAAYVCLDDDPLSLEVALVLHQLLTDREVPIVMRSGTAGGLSALLEAPRDDPFRRLRAFALLERVCAPDLVFGGTEDVIARALHDVYVQNREAEGWRWGPRRDDDRRISPALAAWDQLDEERRAANRDQAIHIERKLAAVGCALEVSPGWDPVLCFTPDEVEQMAVMEHDRWVEDRTHRGWTLGPADDDEKRTPYLVPWEELSEPIREYDREFVRELPVVLAKVGLRVART